MFVGTITRWLERVYLETDFGRNMGISISGVVGLITYLMYSDVVIAAFSWVIAFPLVRTLSTRLHDREIKRAKRRSERETAERQYERLSDSEKQVVSAFVEAGGSVLRWRQVNELALPSAAIESLIQRDLLTTGVMADGMTETFVLDTIIYDVGVDRWRDITP